MKPVDRRKLFSSLHREARKRHIEMIEDTDAGNGSHGSIVFRGPCHLDPIRLVIVYSRDISPGVQRSMLKYLTSLQANAAYTSENRLFAETVRDMLSKCLAH